MKLPFSILILFFTLFSTSHFYGQTDSTKTIHKQDYQIYLKQPVKEIKMLMYEKKFFPIHGKLSEDRKSIIMSNYEPGTRIHVIVIYDDGTVDDFIKSPCYIDPVI